MFLNKSFFHEAIQQGNIQITDAYSTDPEIAQYDLVVLEDNQHLFPPYQGAPLMKEALIKKHPELEGILNKLSGKITESQMSQMNYQVGVEGKPVAKVARDFLVKQGLLKKRLSKKKYKKLFCDSVSTMENKIGGNRITRLKTWYRLF